MGGAKKRTPWARSCRELVEGQARDRRVGGGIDAVQVDRLPAERRRVRHPVQDVVPVERLQPHVARVDVGRRPARRSAFWAYWAWPPKTWAMRAGSPPFSSGVCLTPFLSFRATLSRSVTSVPRPV